MGRLDANTELLAEAQWARTTLQRLQSLEESLKKHSFGLDITTPSNWPIIFSQRPSENLTTLADQLKKIDIPSLIANTPQEYPLSPFLEAFLLNIEIFHRNLLEAGQKKLPAPLNLPTETVQKKTKVVITPKTPDIIQLNDHRVMDRAKEILERHAKFWEAVLSIPSSSSEDHEVAKNALIRIKEKLKEVSYQQALEIIQDNNTLYRIL